MSAVLSTEQIGQCIKAHRIARNMTLVQLETVTGIDNSSLSRIENDEQNLTNRTMVQLASAFNIPLSELFADVSPEPAAWAVTIPALGITAAGEVVIDESERHAFLLEDLQRAGAQARAFIIPDDAMAEKLLPGDVTAVDIADNEIPPTGGIFVIKMGTALTVRQLFPAPNGGITIMAVNPRYPTVTLGFNESVEIVARVKVARSLSGF